MGLSPITSTFTGVADPVEKEWKVHRLPPGEVQRYADRSRRPAYLSHFDGSGFLPFFFAQSSNPSTSQIFDT
jgi:hypothetical protein